MQVSVVSPDGTRVSVFRFGSTSMEGFHAERDGFVLKATGYQSEGATLGEAMMRGAMSGLREGTP
jgi:hypothetical protein